MKTVIISGTPKREGLCASLVRAAYDALPEGSREIINLSDYTIEACRMCGDGWGICKQPEHKCIIDDDFEKLRLIASEAGSIVLVTPVYWGEASDIMKRFLDRFRRCEGTRGDKRCFLGTKFLLVASAGGSGGGILTCLELLQRAVMHMGGSVYDYIGVNRWNAEYKRNAIAPAVHAMINSDF